MKLHSLFALLVIGLLLGSGARAQTYEPLLAEAARQIGQQNYCAATTAFTTAFADSTQVGPYDLYAGAGAAAQCPGQQAQALRWLLQLTRHPALAITAPDIDNMAQDAGLRSLHTAPEWPLFLASLRQTAARRLAEAQQARVAWQRTTLGNALPLPISQGTYPLARPGFALYYAPVDTVRVPYLVYVPEGYRPTHPTALLVYLHGGLVNTTQFQATDPRVAEEPIFAAARTQQALVLYPFGRRSFGWLEQRAALQNVRVMIEHVKQRYHVDRRRIYLGGMSNGGTATFWYACQDPAGFAGFFALSAHPSSPLGPLNFGRLRRGAPLYSLHAQDDEVVAYQGVQMVYATQQAHARQWHFLSRATGGHGFLYGLDGLATLQGVLAQLMLQPNRRPLP